MAKAKLQKKNAAQNVKKAVRISLAQQVSFAKKNCGEAAKIKLSLRKKCLMARVSRQYDGWAGRICEFAKQMGSRYVTKDLFGLFCGGLEVSLCRYNIHSRFIYSHNEWGSNIVMGSAFAKDAGKK